MIIGHVNLAAGFRGGERQTELLIRELSARGFEQIAVVRKESDLGDRLADVKGLKIRRICKPYILGVGAARGCDLLHAHEAKASQYTYWVRRLLGIPYVITRRVPRVPGSNPLTRAVYRNASAVIALSQAIKASMLQHNPELNVQIIPSMSAQLPVNADAVDALRERFAGKFLIGHIGALVNYHKGQQYLIEAARKLATKYPQMHFIFLGRGKDEAWFRELAQGLDNITFEGFVDNVGDYLEVFDLFAFPSLQEGLGSILLDAMRAKLPVVASNVDGIPDLIHQGRNGLLVPVCGSQALEQAIERLYRDEALRKELSEQAKVDAFDYVPEKITQRIIDLYYR
ncbi:MAG: glycosyltransferase family 4 protein [Gammaproteobacteria bacterium]|nr:glycosyltransferase family 4 protein [Gammaproteobacteria bacterium]